MFVMVDSKLGINDRGITVYVAYKPWNVLCILLHGEIGGMYYTKHNILALLGFGLEGLDWKLGC